MVDSLGFTLRRHCVARRCSSLPRSPRLADIAAELPIRQVPRIDSWPAIQSALINQASFLRLAGEKDAHLGLFQERRAEGVWYLIRAAHEDWMRVGGPKPSWSKGDFPSLPSAPGAGAHHPETGHPSY